MSEYAVTTRRNKAHSKPKLLKIQNLVKAFPGNDYNVIDDVSLNVTQGDLFVLVGPSGCGKSTLLRVIAGFEKPTSGKILLNGEDITNIPPYKRPINMMFQSYALFPHMNVMQNVAFGLKQEKNLSNTEIDTRVGEALDMVNMTSFSYRKPDQLSGGQMQRVALARSLVKRPELLLLDEPLGALDRKTRERTQIELIKIQYTLGITFIMVTHDQEEAMAMADCMAVMNEGKVLQIGTAQDIYESPNSRFVAEFVDSINLFEGKIVKKRNVKGFVGIKIKESDNVIYAKSETEVLVGGTVWLGLRPEEVEIDLKEVKGENQVSGTIIDFGFLGQKIVYHIELQNEKTIHVTIPTSERARNPNFVLGRNVYVSWYYSDGVVLTE